MGEQRTGTRLRSSLEPLALGLTIFGACARLIPHPPNFAPVGGMSLFAGSRLRGWQAYLVPVLLMVVTDPLRVALFHPGFPAFSSSTPFIYASLLINVWIGRRWLQTPNARRIALTAFFGSLQFFLITNLAAFVWEASYPQTAAGLIACYVAAIPFYGRTLASDLFYSGLLFSLHAWTRRVASSKWVPATK